MHSKLYVPSTDEVDAAVEQLIARRPTEAARYMRAAASVIAGCIGHDDAGWTVASLNTAGKRGELAPYKLTPVSCECYDFKHGGKCCKHLSAMQLYVNILAARLDATFGALQDAARAHATAYGWRAFNDAESAEDALAAAEYAERDPVLGDDQVYIIPGSQPNYSHILDRRDDTDICTALQMPNGKWRPAQPSDTLAWAYWLGSRQGAAAVVVVEPEPVAPAPTTDPRTLAAVLAALPVGAAVVCDLRQDWGAHTYVLEAYRYPDTLRVVVPAAEQVTLTTHQFGDAIVTTGCQVAARSRGTGFSYHYVIEHKPADGSTALGNALDAAKLLADKAPAVVERPQAWSERNSHKTAYGYAAT